MNATTTDHQHEIVEGEAAESTEPRSGRERILAEARILFVERGYAAVSMREIADAAGLRKASIYHHFRDKEELFSAIVLGDTIAMRHRMQASLEGVEGFLPRLRRLTETQMIVMRSHSMRLAEDFRIHIPESRHDEMHAELENLFGVYDGLFAEAHAHGEITGIEPSLAAACYFQIVLSMTWDWMDKLGTPKPEPERLADLAMQIMLFGVASPALR